MSYSEVSVIPGKGVDSKTTNAKPAPNTYIKNDNPYSNPKAHAAALSAKKASAGGGNKNTPGWTQGGMSPGEQILVKSAELKKVIDMERQESNGSTKEPSPAGSVAGSDGTTKKFHTPNGTTVVRVGGSTK